MLRRLISERLRNEWLQRGEYFVSDILVQGFEFPQWHENVGIDIGILEFYREQRLYLEIDLLGKCLRDGRKRRYWVCVQATPERHCESKTHVSTTAHGVPKRMGNDHDMAMFMGNGQTVDTPERMRMRLIPSMIGLQSLDFALGSGGQETDFLLPLGLESSGCIEDRELNALISLGGSLNECPDQMVESATQGIRELSHEQSELLGQRRCSHDLHPKDIETQFRIVLTDNLILVRLE